MLSGRIRIGGKKKKVKVPITRDDLQDLRKASQEELSHMQKSLEGELATVKGLLKMTPRERLRLMKSQMKAKRHRGQR